MPKVIVNIFNGVGEQVPTQYEIEADVYQDIVSALIRGGIESGQIYGLNGEVINYEDLITMKEVNYIIPDNISKHQIGITLPGPKRIVFYYNIYGTFRDIYNELVAKYNIPKNTRPTIRGLLVDLDEPLVKHDPLFLNAIDFVVRSNINVTGINKVQVRVTSRGIVEVPITWGSTSARQVIEEIGGENNLKLAKVKRGEYGVHIYEDHELMEQLEDGERLYLVPDYETLLAAYSAMTQGM